MSEGNEEVFRKMISVALRNARSNLFQLITTRSDKLQSVPDLAQGAQETYKDAGDFIVEFDSGSVGLARARIYLSGLLTVIRNIEKATRNRWILKLAGKIFRFFWYVMD